MVPEKARGAAAIRRVDWGDFMKSFSLWRGVRVSAESDWESNPPRQVRLRVEGVRSMDLLLRVSEQGKLNPLFDGVAVLPLRQDRLLTVAFTHPA